MPRWYHPCMDTTHATAVGDRGRMVLPLALRENQGWQQGTPLLLVETEHGVVVVTREQARDMIREQLSGSSLVEELINERRLAALAEGVA